MISPRSAATGGGRGPRSNGSGCGVGFGSAVEGAVEDGGMSLEAAVLDVDGEGLAFSLFVSCDEGVVPEELGASTGSEEGSGAGRRGDGPRPGRLGGGIFGMGKSLCAFYVIG